MESLSRLKESQKQPSESQSVKPDLWLVKIPETIMWLDLAMNEAAGVIYSVYLFDRSVNVHCAELTPSYELRSLYTTYSKAQESDEAAEKLNEYIDDGVVDDPQFEYYHVRNIERMLKDNPENFHHVGEIDKEEMDSFDDYDDMMDWHEDHYRCNWML
jgi:hypothetical protein